MARQPRRDDADRDPFDNDEDRDYAPPSKRTAAIVIGLLVCAGLMLIAYFVLELQPEDMGGTAAWVVVVVLVVIVGRGRFFR